MSVRYDALSLCRHMYNLFLQLQNLLYFSDLIHLVQHIGEEFRKHNKKLILVLPPPVTKG